MKPMNAQVLFSALGFLAVLMKGQAAELDGAKRAKAMAELIEMFCRTARPDLFSIGAQDDETIDAVIERMKTSRHIDRIVELTGDRELLRQVYDRLQERHRSYATDELIADEVVHLLEEEVKHAAEADMRIIHVQGALEAFTPYERLAAAIASVLRGKGECYPEDLDGQGFTPEEIRDHWTTAYNLAMIGETWLEDKIA